MSWPRSDDELVARQIALAREAPEPWEPPAGTVAIGGCFVCFPRGPSGPGDAGDPAWAGAAVCEGDRLVATAVVEGRAGAPFKAGLLALREGALLEAALRAAFRTAPAVAIVVNASGRDHPRRAGLAVELGAAVGVPSIGVTHRPLLASGDWPEDRRGATSPLAHDGDVVGAWLRVRAGARPLAVHPGWRTNLDTAIELALRTTRRTRTPAPLRAARRGARSARARAGQP